MFSFPITISPGTNNETEKSPFLEPVRLTPAWEENNLPNDELNFRGKYGPILLSVFQRKKIACMLKKRHTPTEPGMCGGSILGNVCCIRLYHMSA